MVHIIPIDVLIGVILGAYIGLLLIYKCSDKIIAFLWKSSRDAVMNPGKRKPDSER